MPFTDKDFSDLAREIAPRPGAQRDGIIGALKFVRQRYADEIANRQSIIERMATGINELAAERDGLRRQLDAAWQPCADGFVHVDPWGVLLCADGETLSLEEPSEVTVELPDDVRLCQRRPGKDA